jgi:hypothetical protein
MTRVSADIPVSQWNSHRVFWDASENIVFLELVKRSVKKPFNGKLAVPGLTHLSFGPAVRPPRPAEATSAEEAN